MGGGELWRAAADVDHFCIKSLCCCGCRAPLNVSKLAARFFFKRFGWSAVARKRRKLGQIHVNFLKSYWRNNVGPLAPGQKSMFASFSSLWERAVQKLGQQWPAALCTAVMYLETGSPSKKLAMSDGKKLDPSKPSTKTAAQLWLGNFCYPKILGANAGDKMQLPADCQGKNDHASCCCHQEAARFGDCLAWQSHGVKRTRTSCVPT